MQVSYQPYLKRRELLYRGDIQSHKVPKEGYKLQGSPREDEMGGYCQLLVNQVRPASSNPVPSRQPNSASESRMRCSQMLVSDRGGAVKNLPYALVQGSLGLDALPALPSSGLPLSQLRATGKVPCVCLRESEEGNENANSDSYVSKAPIY